MHFEPHSFLTRLICRARLMWQVLMQQAVLPVDAALSSVLQERLSLVRSCAPRMARWNIRDRSFLIRLSGDRTSGIRITVTTARLTVTIPERHHVRQHVRHIFRYRAMSRWLHREDTWMHLSLSRLRIRSRQYAVLSVTDAARTHVREVRSMRRLQSMRLRSS